MSDEVAMTRSQILLVAASWMVATPAAKSEVALDPATRTMLNMRVAGAILASYKDAHGELPELGLEPVEPSRVIDELGNDLGTDLRKVLAAHDGWGNSLRYVATHGHYMIISLGADGREDVPYAELLSQKAISQEPETRPDSPERDIVFADGDFAQRPPPKVPATKQTMADLRSIGTAVESFAVDNERYPGPTTRVQTIDALASDLESTYIRALPRLDCWGHPYLVWSDTQSYFLISTGADGIPDRDYLEHGNTPAELAKDSAATSDPNADVVFANGQFTQWPSDADRP
jgi:hypothetical protein